VSEWSLSTLPSPIPELQHAPLPLKVLWARERVPTLPSSTVFLLGLTFEPFEELGVRQTWLGSKCKEWVVYYQIQSYQPLPISQSQSSVTLANEPNNKNDVNILLPEAFCSSLRKTIRTIPNCQCNFHDLALPHQLWGPCYRFWAQKE
jgi:hypothetical protein